MTCSPAGGFAIENRALVGLTEAMANGLGADGVLQNLVETPRWKLCQAHSAGVSILEKGEKGVEVSRWRAAAGRWSSYRGDVMSREPGSYLPLSGIALFSILSFKALRSS